MPYVSNELTMAEWQLCRSEFEEVCEPYRRSHKKIPDFGQWMKEAHPDLYPRYNDGWVYGYDPITGKRVKDHRYEGSTPSKPHEAS
jgi:hypothetical protein